MIYYDVSLITLKKELELSFDLVWNQTHMVNNYRTCDYYHSKGVKYALLGKEITLDEIVEICNKSSISCMVEVVSLPSVAFSRRKLIEDGVWCGVPAPVKPMNKPTPSGKLEVYSLFMAKWHEELLNQGRENDAKYFDPLFSCPPTYYQTFVLLSIKIFIKCVDFYLNILYNVIA